jgi:hemerythrin-like domain-containing protein
MSERFDIYRNIHMGLRACMMEVLLAVGRMDPEDVAELGTVLGQVRFLLRFCQMHLKKEDKFLHPAMEARAPGSTAHIAAEHEEHLAAFATLEAAVVAVEQAGDGTRLKPALALYKQLSLFVGENFVHMHIEETEHNEVLWRTHSDAEIIAIEQAIIASLTPEDKPTSLRWMLPALSPQVRAMMVGMLAQHLPPDAMAGLLQMLKPHLSGTNWGKLTKALDKMPVAA